MKATRRSIVGVIILAALFFLIEVVQPFRALAEPFIRLARPIESFLYDRSSVLRQSLFRVLQGEQGDELIALREQVTHLGVDAVRLAELEKENARLKELLQLKEGQAWNEVTTRVVGRDPRNPRETIRLAAGRRDGLVQGSAVIDASGFLIAVVDTVGESTSTGTVLHSRGLQLAARVLGRDGMIGLLESADGLSLKVKQLPKEGILNVGDIVVTGAESPAVPPGIPIGSIVSISGNPEDIWKEAVISPLASLGTTSIVSVIVSAHE